MTILFTKECPMCLPDFREAGVESGPQNLEFAVHTPIATVSKLVARLFRRAALLLEQWSADLTVETRRRFSEFPKEKHENARSSLAALTGVTR